MRLDGNVAAGDLREVFPFEPTLVVATCADCGARGALGGAETYVDAPGIVIRCASCEAVLLSFARKEQRVWVEFSGCASIEIEVA